MTQSHPGIHLLTGGHKGSGKSTLLGHLLHSLHGVGEEEYVAATREAELFQTMEFRYAFLLDTSREERRRGVGLNLTHRRLPGEGDRPTLHLIDAPGQKDLLHHFATGAAGADALLLTVSAAEGEAEAAFKPLSQKKSGQALEHLHIARAFGVTQIVVAVTKVDRCEWSGERFEAVKGLVEGGIAEAGFATEGGEGVSIVPVGGVGGENLAEPTDKMEWFGGSTLLDAIGSLTAPDLSGREKEALRIPVQTVFNHPAIGPLCYGRVESGRMEKGDIVLLAPTGEKGVVRMLRRGDEIVEAIAPGEGVAFSLGGIQRPYLRKGNVVTFPDSPVQMVQSGGSFEARIRVIEHPEGIAQGEELRCHIHTADLPVEVGEVLEGGEDAKRLKSGEEGRVRLVPRFPVVVGTVEEEPRLGRFVLRGRRRTVAAGEVVGVG